MPISTLTKNFLDPIGADWMIDRNLLLSFNLTSTIWDAITEPVIAGFHFLSTPSFINEALEKTIALENEQDVQILMTFPPIYKSYYASRKSPRIYPPIYI